MDLARINRENADKKKKKIMPEDAPKVDLKEEKGVSTVGEDSSHGSVKETASSRRVMEGSTEIVSLKGENSV